MKRALFVGLLLTVAGGLPTYGQDRSFGGFDCADDCSGHAAGYQWADRHNIESDGDCPQGNSESFHEGCIAYTQDSTQDADTDDQGHEVGEPVPRDSDENE